MRIEASGIGAGTRNPSDAPNVLRATLGVRNQSETVDVLQAQMDDLTGEHLPPLIDALLAAGALDAYAVPVLMKKGRSGLLVTALAKHDDSESVEQTMLRHGSTFGVRKHTASRTVLDRWHETVETSLGSVRIKVGAIADEIIHAAPEFEDVLRLAQQSGTPVPVVHAAAVSAWHKKKE